MEIFSQNTKEEKFLFNLSKENGDSCSNGEPNYVIEQTGLRFLDM
jgi:hypothetical protein